MNKVLSKTLKNQKNFYALIISILLITVVVFSVLSVTVPNYYMKGKGCFGIFTSEMEGTPCLGECKDKKCGGSALCKANKSLPLVVAGLALLSIVFCAAGNQSLMILTTFAMLMVSIEQFFFKLFHQCRKQVTQLQ